jgi:anti-sigma factor ChrR (cupin superfamily)
MPDSATTAPKVDASKIPEHLRSHYVDVVDMPWEQLSEKSFRKILFKDEKTGRETWLSKVLPGGVIPYHEHPDLEMTYVLEGALVDDEGACTAGNFVWRPAGSRHTARAPEGALFIAFFGKASKRL